MEEEMVSAVDALYHFRDHYFVTHAITEAADKTAKVEERLKECMDVLDRLSASARGPEASALCQRGRALNVLPDHSPEAERLLSRAVKLSPTMVEGWNELGECYWKRGDVENARTCFEGALRHGSDKVSLRNLSIVLRQRVASAGQEENLRSIEQGLTKAREAVQLDTSDGISWSILGNAYLMHYFSVAQNPRTLKQAMTAYKMAEKDVIAASSPELHYNKGVAQKYEEDYRSALESFDRAKALDPSWEKATLQKRALLQTLTDIKNLIETKGKLKTKRFNSLVSSIDAKSLSPFRMSGSNNSEGLSSITSSSSSLNLVDFKDLKEGLNRDKVVLGKVICSVHSEESVPFTFCLTDQTGHCLAVNLYNLAPGKGVIIGDSVGIAEPYFTKVRVETSSTEKEEEGSKEVIEFDLIRVDSPLVLVINGKRASQDLQAGVELSTFTKTD